MRDMHIYPWQTDLWRQLGESAARRAHALLLQGRSGIGKLAFARALAQALLCEKPQQGGFSCGRCTSCNWFLQDAHPDFRLLQPEALGEPEESGGQKKPSRHITIEQVRELTDFINLTTHRNGWRIVLIHPAEAMNINSANALLKILEEPPQHTLFILVSHKPHQLLSTMRSRCHKIDMPVPARMEALNWLREQGVREPEICLAQAGGAPLEALALAEEKYQQERREFLLHFINPAGMDPIQLAEASEVELVEIVAWLQKWAYDLLSIRLAGKIRYHQDFAEQLHELAKSANVKSLLGYQRELLGFKRVLQHPLNSQLLLEQLMFSYQKCIQPGNAHEQRA